MKSYRFEAKTKEEAIELAIKELKVNESDLIIKVVEEKTGLFKKITIEVYDINEIVNYIKESLEEIITLMNITLKQEVRRRGYNINIHIFSSNNSILIGKNGRTITALQNIMKKIITNNITDMININIDIENYKEKRQRSIESLAKRTAREVGRTKIETKLYSMNSYERRIVHNILSNNKYVTTSSEGEEPNRYVVIKPKEV
ncbi:MAG: RNA-binding cell elongation regulator Jag/EloR [bacterium]|nr:RNA-binding cell elongation regulator Jag/EloR [bacterium]